MYAQNSLAQGLKKATLVTCEERATCSIKLRVTMNKIDDCAKNPTLKLNQSTFTHIIFTLGIQTCPVVQMGNVALPLTGACILIEGWHGQITSKQNIQTKKKTTKPES
jgi:hypothetical protein